HRPVSARRATLTGAWHWFRGAAQHLDRSLLGVQLELPLRGVEPVYLNGCGAKASGGFRQLVVVDRLELGGVDVGGHASQDVQTRCRRLHGQSFVCSDSTSKHEPRGSACDVCRRRTTRAAWSQVSPEYVRTHIAVVGSRHWRLRSVLDHEWRCDVARML